MNVKKMLNDRADSYSRDALVFHHDGDHDAKIMYRTIADELRKVADKIETEEEPCHER